MEQQFGKLSRRKRWLARQGNLPKARTAYAVIAAQERENTRLRAAQLEKQIHLNIGTMVLLPEPKPPDAAEPRKYIDVREEQMEKRGNLRLPEGGGVDES